MSISHPPQPPAGGDAGCGNLNPMPDWVWLTQRFEDNVQEGFGAWIDEHLHLMESELSEFASSHGLSARKRSLTDSAES